MAFESNLIHVAGNLTEDPELRFTPSGAAVVNGRIAINRKWTDKSGQQQEDTTFLNFNAWRDLAENVAESLNKGDRVVIVGRIKNRSYENKSGVTVWVTEIEADEVSPSLRWATATVQRAGSSKAGGRSGGGGFDAPPPPADDDVPFRWRPAPDTPGGHRCLNRDMRGRR